MKSRWSDSEAKEFAERYGKLGVNTRGGATLFAMEHGLLRPGQI